MNRTGPMWWARRVALFALMALEMAVAVSPILEPHHSATASHVEQSGTTHHHLVHDDHACPVCALRSLRQLHSTASIVIPTAAPSFLAATDQYVLVLSRDATAHAPRAPPVTG